MNLIAIEKGARPSARHPLGLKYSQVPAENQYAVGEMLEPFFAPNRLRGQREQRDACTHVHCDDDADCCLRVQQPAVLVVSGRHHRPAPDGLQGASAAAARSRATRRAAGWGRVGRWVGGWRSRHNADAARTTTNRRENRRRRRHRTKGFSRFWKLAALTPLAETKCCMRLLFVFCCVQRLDEHGKLSHATFM